jgi:zinc transport system permease protein
MDDFFVRALLAGVGLAFTVGPLGCFVIWRRMAYFGDTMSHSALLGVGLGFLAGIAPAIGVAAVTTAIALLLFLLQRSRALPVDTLLGILSHGALSIGLVVVSLMSGLRIDLMAYLFGDVLSVSRGELASLWAGGAVILVTLLFIWRPLLAVTVDEDLARAEGIKAGLVRGIFMLLIALTIALSMRIVGILLITSLLIIPAAAARQLSRSPEMMAVLAAIIGVAAATLGLGGSFMLDTPSGPSIVVVALGLFVLLSLIKVLRHLRPAR